MGCHDWMFSEGRFRGTLLGEPWNYPGGARMGARGIRWGIGWMELSEWRSVGGVIYPGGYSGGCME